MVDDFFFLKDTWAQTSSRDWRDSLISRDWVVLVLLELLLGKKGDELTLKMDQSVLLFYQYQVFNRILDGGALMLLTSRWSTTFQSNFAVLWKNLIIYIEANKTRVTSGLLKIVHLETTYATGLISLKHNLFSFLLIFLLLSAICDAPRAVLEAALTCACW